MEQLKTKYLNFATSLEALQSAVEDFEQVKKNSLPDPKNYIRDALLKRFELAVDHSCKYQKDYLESICGISLQARGPKPMFRECLRAGVLNETDTIKAIEMIDSRNLVSHIYKDETSDIISKKIGDYCSLMKKLKENAKPE